MLPVVRQIELEIPRSGHSLTLFVEVNLGGCNLQLLEGGDRWQVDLPWESLIQCLKLHGKKVV